MCFSQEASFTLGVILSVTGLAAAKKVGWSRRLPIALMPLLFGLQQISEGVVWHYINNPLTDVPIASAAEGIFLLLAWVIWPVYAPFVFLLPEPKGWRRPLFLLCLLGGVIIAEKELFYLLDNKVTATVVGNSLYYEHPTTLLGEFTYGVASLVPLTLSSLPNMWLVGVALFVSWAVSQWIWTQTVTSVWCFFAAVVSFLLYIVLEKEKTTLQFPERTS